jgi:aryl-alcohol dehydrogenase
VANVAPGGGAVPVLMAVRALVSRAAGAEFQIEELVLEAPREDEVLVDIVAAGVCHTDITVSGGSFPTPFPVVLGHEGAGIVTAVGAAVDAVAVGDHVALSYDSCGRCRSCLLGRSYHCHRFFERNFLACRADGSTSLSAGGGPVHSHFFGQSSFATQAVVAGRSVVAIPRDIPFELAAPLGCGVQTGTGTVLNALRPPAGASFAVFGAGGVGLSAVMAARIAAAATIVIVDLVPSRLELARELGATHAIDARGEDPVEAIMRIAGVGVDYAIEASGSTTALRQAVDALGPGGTCALVGAPPFGEEVSLDVNTVLARGRTIRAVVEGHSVPAEFIPRLVAFWRAGMLPLERLVRTYPLAAVGEAVADAERGVTVKPVLLTRG